MFPGPTRSISTSARSVSTPLPTGLATCLWSTRNSAWTPCSSKIKCQSSVRNIKTSRGRDVTDRRAGPSVAAGFWRTPTEVCPAERDSCKLSYGQSDRPWWAVDQYKVLLNATQTLTPSSYKKKIDPLSVFIEGLEEALGCKWRRCAWMGRKVGYRVLGLFLSPHSWARAVADGKNGQCDWQNVN